MSEGDVSLIRDEDVLRRMWQQTEDFSKKKEIRAHMYRLREERLRSLYSPEPPRADTKGCEFTSAQGHVNSFADQNFQSMKSKEVRDAGSPPKEFTFRGQDLKEYSNAGWNVEREERTADEGRTQTRALHADVAGRYDVPGGAGAFAARDALRETRSEHSDAAGSVRRHETAASSTLAERVERTDPDHSHHTTTNTSSSSSRVQQVSSTKHESVPYMTEQDHDLSRHTTQYDTNRNENVTRTTNRNDYEQNVRRTESDHGELVSRKVEYPDDNTRVTVETRCLPDGTRVTSTRREFRVPAQASRTSTESRSYSAQQKSDTRDSSSKVTRHVVDDRREDIVDSRRQHDDHDFKRQIRDYVVSDNDNPDSQQRSDQSHQTSVRRNVTDHSRTENNVSKTSYDAKTTNKVTDHSTASLVQSTNNIQRLSRQRYDDSVDQTDRREVIRNDYVSPKDVKDVHHERTTVEDHITKDKKVEEVVERKTSTDRYQTTYQSDYQQKKVSNDWSPSQQAWASSLRADTPSTTRPSTRASSPGGRTFESSTSSLRSSVSPDKTYRKPTSRGGSPNKIDRGSPTRTVTSDRYSSTHSTHSTTETKTNKKYSSPERKPPSGLSPTRPGYSPERKPQDERSPRSSMSPEKTPQNVTSRPSVSPDRKPKPTASGESPKTTPTRAAGLPSDHPSRSFSPDKAPRGPKGSPERDIGYQQTSDAETPNAFNKRPSMSPDRKPGYMRPTAASQPTPEVRKPSQSPDRKQQYTKTDKVIDEHYKFIDEESKTHIRNEKTNVLKQFTSSKPSDSKPQDKTPSARGKSPEKTPKSPSSPVGKGRSSSPQKRTLVVTENDELYGRIEKSFEIVTDEQDVTIKTKQDRKYTPKDKNAPSRETSPSKYDTYDKKKSKETVTVNMSTLSTEETEQFDSLTRNETITKKSSDRPSPARKSPGRSPVSVRDNDTKHKETTDFISTEIMTEEVNKKSTSKEHPRQLVTPSSSPTRKPKQTETEPSTGQSSPTTSVSGFIYFGSPRNEMPQVTDLDDHYEPTPEEESPEGTPSRMRPDSLEVKRSPSPSKIPCKSPSPAPIKEKLPRKSSLKKPKDVNLASPIEKPPTSFQVSPTEDRPLPEYNIVKKDKPEEPIADSPKPKPPLQRRETYEDRCRKILGMVDDTTTETISKETRRSMRRPNSVPSSPSVSPCDSPAPKESFPFPDKVTFTETDIKSNISDFITREKTTEIHNNVTPKQPSRETSPNKLRDIQNVKHSVNENKRTEVKDKATTTTTNIMNNVTHTTSNRIIEDVNKLSRSSESPEKPKVSGTPRGSSPSKNARPIEAVVDNKRQSPRRASPEKLPVVSPVKESSPTRTNPKRTPGYTQTFTTTTEFESSSTADINDTSTDQNSTTKRPTRVLESPTRQIPTERNDDQLPKSLRSPTKPSSSPERKASPKHGQDFPKGDKDDEPTIKSPGRSRETTPGYMRTTTAISSKFDKSCTTEDIETVTSSKTVERKQSVSKTKSPSRKPSQESPRTKSPTKTTPKRPDHSPDHKPEPKRGETKNEIPETKQPRELPGYMRTTTSTVARKDSTTTEEIHEITSIKTDEKQTSPKSSVSPTRRPSQKKLETSPDRKPSYQRPASPSKDESKPRNDPRFDVISPTPSSPDSVPGYMRTTESVSSKFEHLKQEQDVKESVTSVIEKHHEKRIKSPVSLKDEESPCVSPSPRQQSKSPDRKYRKPSEDTQSRKPKDQHPTDTPKIPGYMKTTTAIANKFDITSTTDDVEPTISLKTIVKETPEPTELRSTSPKRSDVSPQRKIDRSSPLKDSLKDVPLQSKVTDVKPPSYMKPTAAVTTKYEIKTATNDTDSKKSTNKSSTVIQNLGKTQEPKPRVPAPSKKISIVTEVSTDFILSEKEQEILDRVQKSLRKLSPDRKEKSPSRERSPTKFTTSLQDLDITATETIERNTFTGKDLCEVVDEHVSLKTDVAKPSKSSTETPKDRKPSSKPASRNVSPTKKPVSTTAKFEKSPDSPTKTRSVSPKKPVPQERPQSPQKPSGIKPREQIPSHLTRKPTPATLKVDKIFTDVRKTNGVTRQNVATKTTVASKTTSSTTKHTSPPTDETPKNKEHITSPKKETVTRTTSDTNIKPKKTSPQRMRSKPEIQISDMSPKSSKNHKPAGRELQSKLPIKPKSATSLNTSTDDDDVIIDVQQSKSSRENSPDRICPTPINFAEDVGTPRFPDEVSEPDDEYRKRSYNTIHEAESVVDDIVEICEDEELFMKQSDMDTIIEADDSLLSVHDKVNKYTKQVGSVSKPKDTTISFKDTEIRVHSDFMDENLKSDECMLTVSEKVNKFAKDQRDTKDKSPSRKITDEYDNDTIYTDDYTKLSVNDKAHLFVETAENIKTPKQKPAQKVERPDLSNVDESLKKDECLLSVSDKVNKFVKTAEQFLTENVEVVEKDKKIKEKHSEILKKIVDDEHDIEETSEYTEEIYDNVKETKGKPSVKQTPTMKHQQTPKTEPLHRKPTVKITTLRSSEAMKKAKALFENIATTQKSNEVITTKTTKLTDIGVIKKSPKTDSTTALHPSVENISPAVPDVEIEVDTTLVSKERPASGTLTKQQRPHVDDRHRSSPSRLTTQSPDISRPKSPMRQSVEATTKTVLTKHATNSRPESPNCRPESPRPASAQDKPDKTPGYLRPTKTSQIKEEAKVEDYEVSSRRGSGKFGVELRRTSVERSTVSSERRRSVDHHQPCIEDIFDLDLLEQMLEKVVGYEQRRRIRAQIRIVKNTEHVESSSQTKTTSRHTTTVHSIGSNKPKSPEQLAKSPERAPKSSQKNLSPDRLRKSSPQKTVPDHSQPRMPLTNGHSKEPTRTTTASRLRPHSPEKLTTKSVAKSPSRHPSPEKKRTVSPTKLVSKLKQNRFNEYASAYMKKVGLNEADKVKFNDTKTKKTKQTIKHETQESVQEFTTTKSFSERTSSKDVIEVVHLNGKRSPSPENRERSAERKAKSPVRVAPSPVGKATSPVRKATSPVRKATSPVRKATSPVRTATSPVRKATSPARKASSPERKAQSPERLHQRTPSPDFKRPVAQSGKETIIKTVYDIEKKIPQKQVKEEKPSWVMNRNLKKITSETRTYSSKKIETEKPKYRAASPSKVISKPIDVITSSYGPGPLDADGKPLFGIKALRNGASNFQVKGTVIRQEFHSRNGGEPEGVVSVTAYSSQPEELSRLMAEQGLEPPAPGLPLTAVTTTKTFGGDTGTTYSKVHTKEERASLEQFTHSDRKMESMRCEGNSHFDSECERSDRSRSERVQEAEGGAERWERRQERRTARQGSVRSLTERFIKTANEPGKVERAYPKAGLILRSARRGSLSSEDAPGLARADSEHSLGSSEEVVVTKGVRSARGPHGTTTTTTTTTTTRHEPGRLQKTTTVMQEPAAARVTTTRHTERSFLDSTTKVTGVQDILTRMKNADIVVQEGDSCADAEARALLNKFLGATVLMAGMQGYVQDQPPARLALDQAQEQIRARETSSRPTEPLDLDTCWDETLLRNLLEQCTDYEQRRRLRARIRALMAEQEACAGAVTAALGVGEAAEQNDTREEEEVTVSSSVRRNSSEKTVSSSTTTIKSSQVSELRAAPKPVSPFAKFRQLEKQNSTNSPNSPKTPQSPGSPSQPYFKFTDPALQTSALTIKERLLQWCRDKTRDYENVKLENFSTSWADGLAFCALVHHFLPEAFDYSQLSADKRRHNFTLAFKVADEKAGIYPLLDVEDMVAMRKPDWKCVFTYVQSIHRRFKDEP